MPALDDKREWRTQSVRHTATTPIPIEPAWLGHSPISREKTRVSPGCRCPRRSF